MLEDFVLGVAEKDCSKGLGSRSKSVRVLRLVGRLESGGGESVDDGEVVFGDMTSVSGELIGCAVG